MISIPQVEKGQGDVIGYKEDDGAWISAFFHLFTALHIVVAVLFHSWPVPDPWPKQNNEKQTTNTLYIYN